MAEFTKLVNTPVTFTATGIPPPLTNAWRINDMVVPGEVNSTFVHTFTTPGVYTVTHEGINDCGPCTPIFHTIEITQAPAQAGFGGAGMLLIAGLTIGLIYEATKKKQSQK